MPYTAQYFIEANEGQFMDFDGSYGAQCVDLFNYYKQQVIGGGWVGTPSTGGAADLWNDFAGDASQYFTKIVNTPEGVPEYGDVVIWRANQPGVTGPAGHVGIFTSGNVSNFVVFNQNYPNNSRCHNQSFPNYAGVLGWLRPKSFLVGLRNPAPEAPRVDPPVVVPVIVDVPVVPVVVPEVLPEIVPEVSPKIEDSVIYSDPLLTPPVVVAHNKGMRINVLQKLASRKLWLAVAALAILVLNGQYDQAVVVVIGYLTAQGYVDSKVN